MHSVAGIRKGPATLLLRVFTFSAIGEVWFGVAILLTVLQHLGIKILTEQSLFLRAMYAPLVTWLVGHILKRIFKRKRPFQAISNFEKLCNSPLDDSFPSLHAGSTVSLFVSLLVLHHPYALGVGAWAVITSFSRLYLGVHYLSDILGGAVLGALISLLMFYT